MVPHPAGYLQKRRRKIINPAKTATKSINHTDTRAVFPSLVSFPKIRSIRLKDIPFPKTQGKRTPRPIALQKTFSFTLLKSGFTYFAPLYGVNPKETPYI